MEVIFTPLARAELLDAQEWYKVRQSGLGNRFLGEVETVVLHLRENPHQFPVVFQDIHRARLRKFPYALLFRVEVNALVVIACFHASRDPREWERRV